jgi:nucleoside-diphosphate-sugar epimerase
VKLLVTGSSGWLCRTLIPQLRAAGYETIGLDPAPGPLTDVVGSAADRPRVTELFEEHRFGGVLHTGALHKPDIARYPQQAFIDINVTGTLNLLEEAADRPGCRFVFTSTTSLMISRAIREERGEGAVWLDETHGPLAPHNIYGVTKLAAEHLCRQHHEERGLPVVILRTSRFFPEDDDTLGQLDQENLKANEMLHRRATVEDMARAHLAALEKVEERGFGLYLVSAPPPFERHEAEELTRDAQSVIARRFPDAPALYGERGWTLPKSIGRVYDGSLIERELGFRYETRFVNVLEALRGGRPSPVANDPSYVSPLLR